MTWGLGQVSHETWGSGGQRQDADPGLGGGGEGLPWGKVFPDQIYRLQEVSSQVGGMGRWKGHHSVLLVLPDEYYHVCMIVTGLTTVPPNSTTHRAEEDQTGKSENLLSGSALLWQRL